MRLSNAKFVKGVSASHSFLSACRSFLARVICFHGGLPGVEPERDFAERRALAAIILARSGDDGRRDARGQSGLERLEARKRMHLDVTGGSRKSDG